MSDTFWFDDFKILLDKELIREYFPTKKMSIEKKLNSLVRFSLYLSFLLSLLTNNINYIFILIVTLFLTYLIYIFRKTDETN